MFGYNYTHSKIGTDGTEYISFLTQPERLDSNGLRLGKAIHIDIDHKKQTTKVFKFHWIRGCPRDFELVKVLKDEVITDSEVPELMRKLGIRCIEEHEER